MYFSPDSSRSHEHIIILDTKIMQQFYPLLSYLVVKEATQCWIYALRVFLTLPVLDVTR